MAPLRIQLLLTALLAGAWMPLVAAPLTGVTFQTGDRDLQKLYDLAEARAASNIVQFTSAMKVLVEGGGYGNVWIETQPMGGEMYAKRNIEVGLNNQRIFIQGQRADGRLPGMIVSGETARKKGQHKHPPEGMIWMPVPGILADFEMFQGYCFPEPAWKMYFWTGKDRKYLAELYQALERHDAYLWRTRDYNGDGLLETWCVWDTGEDSSTRLLSRNVPTRWPFDFAPVGDRMPDPQVPENFNRYWGDQLPPPTREEVLAPIASMDIMSYSYSGRATLAKIAGELGNGRDDYWRQQAEDVRQRLIKGLWNPARHACFDRDRTGRPMPELTHNNLRAMYFGVFTQEMANEFIRYHLLNPDEFWTPLPLPSIAIHEPLYRNIPNNDWSGQPQGLTYQRAIQALENYSHYAEVSLLGEKSLESDHPQRQQVRPAIRRYHRESGGFEPGWLWADNSGRVGIHLPDARRRLGCEPGASVVVGAGGQRQEFQLHATLGRPALEVELRKREVHRLPERCGAFLLHGGSPSGHRSRRSPARGRRN